MNYNIDELLKNLPPIRIEDVLPVFQCPCCYEDMTKIGIRSYEYDGLHRMVYSCRCSVWVFEISVPDIEYLLTLKVKDIFDEKYWKRGRKVITRDQNGIVTKIDYELKPSEIVPLHYYRKKERVNLGDLYGCK